MKALAVFAVTSLLLLGSPLNAHAQDDGRQQLFMGLLTEGRSLAERGFYYEACVAFNGILERGAPEQDYYKEAEYNMAANLHRLGLLYSSFVYFSRITDSGESHPFYAQAIPWFLAMAREVPGFQGARQYLSMYDPALYPEQLKNELAYVVGDYYYSLDELDSSLESLKLVSPNDEELYLKSLYLSGVIFARKDKAKESMDAFREILKYVDSKDETNAFRDLMKSRASLAAARIFYSVGSVELSQHKDGAAEFDKAISLYNRIERYSTYWLQALFEKSWAYFRKGDYERAMGNLHTLNSPYFEEQFFPESHVLQAVILFTNCRYDDVVVVVDAFVKEYDELRKELNAQLQQNEDPADFYYWLSSLGQKGAGFSRKLKKIFNLGLADRKLYRLFTFIVSLQREEGLLENMRRTAVQKDLAERLLGELVTYRELAIGEVGEQAKDRLNAKRKELQSLVTKAMTVKFEALRAIKEMNEGNRDLTKETGESKGFSVENDDEHLAWPFEGEYWKDELDSYLFRVENLCPEVKPTTTEQ